jgi:hypothetical protein
MTFDINIPTTFAPIPISKKIEIKLQAHDKMEIEKIEIPSTMKKS